MIYVHIPFCRSFCTYCDFYSEIATATCRGQEIPGRYAAALEKEVGFRSDEIRESVSSPDSVDTLYIGGGTPSVLPLSVFRTILDALQRAGVSLSFKEFTVEVNPDDIVEKGHSYVEGLLELGVNRISMGVQSFDDSILRWMNRRHSAVAASEAYRILEESGVGNISIDLIFGLPQLDDEIWRQTLDTALGISSKGNLPNHISSYQLSVEPGSALARLVDQGRWKEAPEELCLRQYEQLCSSLKAAGYNHYEISNFALPGYEAVHNSAYWKHLPYVGLGPGAHSFEVRDGAGMRKWNNPDLDSYLVAMEAGLVSDAQGFETLTAGQLILEKIMLGLRTSSGVESSFLMQHCSHPDVLAAVTEGNLEYIEEDRIRIPENRFFISDSIISSIV